MFVSLGGPTAEDDFDVMDDNGRIGRVYYQPSSGKPWRWNISERLAAQKRGRANTRAEAVQALAEVYSEIGRRDAEAPSIPRRSIEAMQILAGTGAKRSAD